MAIQPVQLLVPTKLTPPKPLGSWVTRRELLDSLNASRPAQIVLIIAPPGFGKSTLVAQWLAEERARPLAEAPASFAWLTLDEHDQDARRFMAYVAEAVERAAPGSLPATRAVLAAPDPPPHVIAQMLLLDLSTLPRGLTLVLDDYHTITAEAVHQIVSYMARHLPLSCRLVLLSRADPPLPLARLRAECQVVEIRADALRLSVAETGDLLARLSERIADAELVETLHGQTEGWAIAVQLAALAGPSTQALDQVMRAATRQIAEFLAEEVLARQPAARLELLLALAVPERFCAGLCAALLGEPEDEIVGESYIEDLVRANLFVIPLDIDERWYRFHHMVHDLLLRRLHLTAGLDGVNAYRRRAAAWLAAEGSVEEAVRLYLAAGEADAAARLVEHMFRPAARTVGLPVVVASAERPPQALPALTPRPEVLTPREAEVLALLAERWSNQEIADRLVVTVNTVRKHTSTIYDKLGAAGRREAVATARALGLLPGR